MSKLTYSQIGNLLNEGLITHKEYETIATRLEKHKAREAEVVKTDQVRIELLAFMKPGTEYKISDLVLGATGVKAPCHGIKETGAQTVYFIPAQLPALVTLDEVEDESEES